MCGPGHIVIGTEGTGANDASGVACPFGGVSLDAAGKGYYTHTGIQQGYGACGCFAPRYAPGARGMELSR